METLRKSGYSMRPAPENEANMFYARTETEYKSEGHIGYLRFDFGKSGEEFWHTWHPYDGSFAGRTTAEQSKYAKVY